MNSFSPDEQRSRRLGRWLTARRNDPRPSPHDPADHAVHDAEQIVGEAWVEILFWHRQEARAAAHTASTHCEDVQRRLFAMLLGRAPTGISAAHADLEAALAAARQAVRTYEQAHQGLILQLELQAWRATERRGDAGIARDGEAMPQARTELPNEAVRPRHAPTRIPRRFPSWLLRLVTNLAGGRRSS